MRVVYEGRYNPHKNTSEFSQKNRKIDRSSVCRHPLNIKLILRYLGTHYTGWQSTKKGTSIEETLEQAIQTLVQHPVRLQATSRTDRGVHAKGQVVNFFSSTQLSMDQILYRLNQLLPKDLSVLSVEAEKPQFHPTLDAVKKRYSYHICNTPIQLPFHRHTSWHVFTPLDIDLMNQAAKDLLGIYDFSAFCNARSLWDRNPICKLEQLECFALNDSRIRIELCADHFLYKMARNLVGTLVYIGCGKYKKKEASAILAGQKRIFAGITAPAHGLALEEVFFGALK